MADQASDLLAQAQAVQRQKLLEQAQAIQAQKTGAQPSDQNPMLQKIKDTVGSYANTAVNELPQIGGAVGGVLGLPEGGVGAIPGAALGGMTGTALQKLIRGYQAQGMDYFTNPQAPTLAGMGQASADLAKGAANGAAGEMGGQAIGGAVNMAKPYVKAAVAKGSEILTGIPKEAYSRLIEQPEGVLQPYTPEDTLNLAQKAQDEFMSNQAASKAELQAAKKAFSQNYGDTPVDTSGILQSNLAKRQNFLPNQSGIGAISPEEAAQLSDLEQRGLMTKMPPPAGTEGPTNYVPTKTGRELQQFADHINAKTNLADSTKLNAAAPDTPFTASMKNMYGVTKDAMHTMSPELAAADQKANQFLTDSQTLSKLAKDNQMESFINNFYGKNKELMRQNASEMIPESIEDIKNLGASQAFNPISQTGSGGAVGKRANFGSVALGTGVLDATRTGNIIPAALGVGAKLATDKDVVKQAVGQGARFSSWLQNNPQVLKAIQSSTGQQLASPWLNVSGGTDQ